jgi:ubiquinone/menaquinone biosynthesis C-methylase UbiE
MNPFDEDYLYFSESYLTPERSDAEAGFILNLLALKEGSQVLDLACGSGRIASGLARRNIKVVGIDLSETAISVARKAAARERHHVSYVVGDMRSQPWTHAFDAIVSWYTSIGYFPDDDNRLVLTQVYSALKPGGVVLIDHVNRDRTLRNFQETRVETRGSDVMLDRNTFDLLTSRVLIHRTCLRSDRISSREYFIRLFTFAELSTWLRDAGFTHIQGYDNKGKPFAAESVRMIITARK